LTHVRSAGRRLAAACLAVAALAGPAFAQVSTTCLRPLAIPDRWVEQNGNTTFEPGTDVYTPTDGYRADWYDGTPLTLHVSSVTSALTASTTIAVQLATTGATSYISTLESCVNIPYGVGDVLIPQFGAPISPTIQGLQYVLDLDPTATWNEDARRVDSVFGLASPRILILPVFDPLEFTRAQEGGYTRIVGFVRFFLERVSSNDISGRLTAYSALDVTAVRVQASAPATLVATAVVPGGPIRGMNIEFELGGLIVGTAVTDFQGRAVLENVDTTWFGDGQYPDAIRARRSALEGFVLPDERTATLYVAPKLAINWPEGRLLRYGVPLGPEELMATANVPGRFTYSPDAGALLDAGQQTLSATFVPDDTEVYQTATVTRMVDVLPAPLTVSVVAVSKLYLDEVPPLYVLATGLVNGDTAAVLSGAPAFSTPATALSPVGAYPVQVSGLSSPNYTIRFVEGTLTIQPRPTSTTVNAPATSMIGATVAISAAVIGGVGTPTGVMEFRVDGTLVGTTPVEAGKAVFYVQQIAVGAHLFEATYAGSLNYLSSTSGAAHTVEKAASFTSLTVSSVAPRYGELVTMTVKVLNPTGLPASGIIAVTDGPVPVGTATLSSKGDSAIAVLTTSTLSPGTHQLRAAYQGSDWLQPSASPSVAITVTPSDTSTVLTINPNPSRAGEAVALKVTMTAIAPGGGIPAGTVDFYEGESRIGTADTVNGIATLTLGTFKAGKHPIEAKFLGTSNYAASASPAVILTVKGGR
jgi:hypothetical protein